MGEDTKRNDLAQAKGLKVIHRIRVLDPDHSEAEDLHRRQTEAMATLIRAATLRKREMKI